MQAGKLDRRIKIFKYSSGIDSEYNSVTETYTEYKEIWAQVTFSNGSNEILADQEVDKSNITIYIRYRTDLSGKDRIQYNNVMYAIIGIPMEIGRKNGLRISAKSIDT